MHSVVELEAAIPYAAKKGHQDVIEILLQIDENEKNPNSIRWIQNLSCHCYREAIKKRWRGDRVRRAASDKRSDNTNKGKRLKESECQRLTEV